MNRFESYTPTDFLRELSLAFGPSGCEGNVADLIREFVAPYADEVTTDRRGTVIATYKKRRETPAYDSDEEPGEVTAHPDCEKLMLSAHMDEVGFMIKAIDGDGYLKMTGMASRDPNLLGGRNVTVGDETRKINGFVGIKAVHQGGVGNFDQLYVDIGAKNKEEAEKYVEPGMFACHRSDFVRFGPGGHKLKGKAIDDRLGCTVLCWVLKHLAETKAELPFDVVCAFTTCEEIGRSSALTAANKIQPDIAINFEATAVEDIIGDKYGYVAKQGQGGCISFLDRSSIVNREMYDFIFAVAEKYGIPAQAKTYVSGGNDAGPIHTSGKGAKTVVISAPARYIHSAANVVDERDLYSIIELAKAAIKELGNA
ncbi:MAG: M20/M25/M40 family metallo-hydrolase [Clostridia bacterium]|nr:M20/M25/M40 family metallo-hydrolase [Clostridia bacterium]MBQ8370436.1 M20/M25/M40 family metallo-hydrolase [Clostridia bacterium]MBQ8512472.1 M20/M25/M40 family metallo-hydrolase [Clostridia bacterium]